MPSATVGRYALIALMLLATMCGAAFAQTGTVVQQIRVDGTQRIDPETVQSYMLIKPGDVADADRLDRSLKALFATGLFADVVLRQEGGTLVVRVVENPIINRIAFEGNRRINEEQLLTEVQLRPRVVYTRTKVQNDVKRILDLYRRSGRFAATVEPKVIQLPQNRVDLVFEISEGQVTGVERINFVGNQRFSDGRLREVIQTRESRWWRILSTDDTYDPDRISFDRELLRKFYLANGYADFRVVSAVAELTPDREGFYITFTIEEGERYKFRTIDVISRLRDLNVDELRRRLTTVSEDWYDADKVEQSINALTDAVGSLGYAFVDIRPRINRDRDAKTVDVTYEIQEGPRVYVERINITGNVRTLDKVIRREMRLAEGDAFNTAKLRRSRQRIRNLGFFERVEVTNVPGDAPDRTVVNIEVQERSTGEVSFGVGFSTADGALADISLRERNLLGRGQDLKLGLTVSQRRQEVDLSFTEPYFLDRNLSAGFDVFHITRDFQRESRFDQENVGFTLRTGYQITEPLRQTLRYTLREDTIENVSPDASRLIREQIGSTLSSIVGQELLYDQRDDRFDPTDGYYVRLINDFAGFGGDVTYLRNRFGAGGYYPIADEWVASLTGELGYIADFGESIRIQNRFFIGGETLRGFASAGIGPRDITTGDALGGREYAIGTAQLTFPSGLPKELGIRANVFSDFGMLRDPDTTGPEVVDVDTIRVSLGVGAVWRSPFGPIRVSLATPVRKEPFDETELFRFSFGSRF
ncbi:MAG TPA: outer membrane protein assembly factor BamA [Alphaproteobacteria bacterium]|nr:outer membrane protein assembly factor BamA [Alphaproteobacteria bacterium]